jgi:hypothetical protein
MTSVLLFLFMLVTSLMFLGMLWGDRISLPNLFTGNWLNPIGDLIQFMSRVFGEFLEVSVEFVVGHLSWVVAAVSGTVGLIIIAFLMGGGLASDAEAYHVDTLAPLHAGGVVDRINVVQAERPRAEIESGIILAKADVDDSQYVDQAVGGRREYQVFVPPELQPRSVRSNRPWRPIDGSIAAAPTTRPLLDRPLLDRPVLDRPVLDVKFQRLNSESLVPDHMQTVRINGRLERDLPNPVFVDRAVRSLLRDHWRASMGLKGGLDNLDDLDRIVPESPLTEVRNLESRIRVTPGVLVSRQDLRVEKTVPESSATGEVTMQVMINNLGRDTIDGLIVRELLPIGTKVRGAVPNCAFRDSTLTWLLTRLEPQQEQVLRFTVIPVDDPVGARKTLFESQTEVSAVTAVTTRTVVSDDLLPPILPGTSVRNRPSEIARAPRLRLQIAEPENGAVVGSWTTVKFRITNIGNASAEGVKLRLVLDGLLDHHALQNDDLLRQVDAPIATINPSNHLDFELVVRPLRAGEMESSAELMFDDQQLALQRFRFVARNARPSTTAPAVDFP